MPSDPTLCRILYTEERGCFRIECFLTRYGGMEVFVMPLGEPASKAHPAWQGDNVLQARAWVDALILRAAA